MTGIYSSEEDMLVSRVDTQCIAGHLKIIDAEIGPGHSKTD